MGVVAHNANIANRQNQVKRLMNNRTGAATVAGGVGFVDSSRSEAESTSISLAANNVTAVTTALMTKRARLVVAADIYADDAEGQWLDADDGTTCLINVDSTTDILNGDLLKPVNGGDHLVKATPGTDIWYARALEGRTANSEGAIRCELYSAGRM